MKICVECRWMIGPENPTSLSNTSEFRCAHPKSEFINSVTGIMERHYCASARHEGGPCKPDAILWEAK